MLYPILSKAVTEKTQHIKKKIIPNSRIKIAITINKITGFALTHLYSIVKQYDEAIHNKYTKRIFSKYLQ